MCTILGVSRSGYYKWASDPLGEHGRADEELAAHIKELFAQSRQTYGIRRVFAGLKARNIRCSKVRVARLMKALDLKVRRRTRYRTTTDSRHCFAVADNLLRRRFAVADANTAWVGDITYIDTAEGWLYLAAVLDLYSRKVIGWSMSESLDATIAVDALKMALANRRPVGELIYHSDRGVQYACRDYQQLLMANSISCSMSRKGNCWDNAVAESFFGSLKAELIGEKRFASRLQARLEIFEYIEVFYNRTRLHSTLGYMSPEQFEIRRTAA